MKQKLIIFVTLGLILVLGIAFIKNDDEKSYEKVRTECKKYGTEVAEKYTNQGDKYYVCK